MASLTRWMWVWVNSGRWWWTGKPGVLRFMGSQRVRHDWATELNWYIYILGKKYSIYLKLLNCLKDFGYICWGIVGFPESSVGKESACNARDQGSALKKRSILWPGSWWLWIMHWVVVLDVGVGCRLTAQEAGKSSRNISVQQVIQEASYNSM